MARVQIHQADVDEKAWTAVTRARAINSGRMLRSDQVAHVEAAIARSLAKLPFRRRRRHL